jgi:hypothetical protein
MSGFRPRLRRNRRIASAATADSGEECRWPGGTIGRGRKGEEESRGRPSYRHRRWDETAGIKEELRGRINRGRNGLRRDLRTEEGDDDVAWQMGPTCR